MRIGIVTQPLRWNYGGILQNFALQTVLKRLGHQVVTLDEPIVPNRSPFRWCKAMAMTTLSSLKHRRRPRYFPFLIIKKYHATIYRHTERFVEQNINVKRNTNHRRLRNADFDALVLGSDQVWRKVYCEDIGISFLEFAKNWTNIKRIAYAASFGTDTWGNMHSWQVKRCVRLAAKFDAMSVREASGTALCKQYFNRDAMHVLDPTMLLDADDYLAVSSQFHIDMDARSLFCYVLDTRAETTAAINGITARLGLTPHYCMPKYTDIITSKEARRHLDESTFPPVEQWLQSFANASMVFTDSFHGTVFSIIFNKPFWVIGNKERGMARFDALLGIYGLQDRIISPEQLATADLNAPIDWQRVNAIREQWKQKSLKFLTDNLI